LAARYWLDEQPKRATERHNPIETDTTMRKILLPLLVATLTCSTASAQDNTKKATATETNARAASDDLNQQKRHLSGELKGHLATAQDLAARALERSKNTTGAEQDKYTATVEALKGLQSRIGDQLNVVNKATDADSRTVFATAHEQIASFRKELDAHKNALVGTTKGAVPTAK
jgi:hypothetical protein